MQVVLNIKITYSVERVLVGRKINAEQTGNYEVARKYSVFQGNHLTVETTKPGTYTSSAQQL
jgi:hypothetical protein